MLVYCDTNIYRHISASGELHEVAAEWQRAGWQVIASSDNLFETFAIDDTETRTKELHVLTRAAHRFDREPESLREAGEVRRAITRYLPQWIRPGPNLTRIRQRLKDHVQRWRDAKKGISPDPVLYGQYRRIYETGVSGATVMQKQLRATRLREEHAVILKRFGSQIAGLQTNLEGPGGFWRMAMFLAYDGALVNRNLQTRDLADWLQPHLKPGKIRSDELFTFWMRDVTPTDVPRAMWIGLVTHAQLKDRVTHGNPADLQHAGHALDVDLFVTADRNFYGALSEAAKSFPSKTARFRLWDRSLPSAVRALHRLLHEQSA